jgi:hypothetical protein
VQPKNLNNLIQNFYLFEKLSRISFSKEEFLKIEEIEIPLLCEGV